MSCWLMLAYFAATPTTQQSPLLCEPLAIGVNLQLKLILIKGLCCGFFLLSINICSLLIIFNVFVVTVVTRKYTA